ncbi:hypothetical protein NLX85_10020 [Micromonospora sp. A3M-1-15]|uniref:hypothetical protein n=1 Tax=Micromonospora sp. A3M-1-15 TaxID=2962035 RepID=UPI0020B6DAB8|nr:hypothetical protein [Micromonospora sp. A3M-1-15]MCP3783698.1 hypothetical protein [Micromonospora sp. A3M-1-15]
MKVKRIVGALTAGACAAISVGVVTASPASAGTANGCGYPQVCFYKAKADWDARRWTAAYKDITSSYQTLSSSAYGSYYVYNTRNDDGALLHYTNGYTYCLRPNSGVNNSNTPTGFWTVDKIRIMDSATC